MRISEQHLKHWLEHGDAGVDDFRTFPSRDGYAYAPMLYRNDARGGHMRDLPFLGDTLNFMAVHSEIVSAKYPGLDDFNQPFEVDYMNTSMLCPNTRGPHEEAAFNLYYVGIDQPYWNEESTSGIAARYPLMDMTPYVDAAAPTPSRKEIFPETLRQTRTSETSVTLSRITGKLRINRQRRGRPISVSWRIIVLRPLGFQLRQCLGVDTTMTTTSPRGSIPPSPLGLRKVG
jgi:hypothetical protein